MPIIRRESHPFNKNPDGTMKDFDQVLADVRTAGKAWQAEPMGVRDVRKGSAMWGASFNRAVSLLR